MQGFSQARKLAETPFPFPISQVILVLLIALTLTGPLMVTAYVTPLWLQVLVTFLGVSTYWALNEVARDLEDPFVYDPNDFPMSYMQHRFNEFIQAAVRGRRPDLEGLTVADAGGAEPDSAAAADGEPRRANQRGEPNACTLSTPLLREAGAA
mmetsp:Transcript_13651/g.32338  ORF Transcript_13651/g.32338 Transcript_13651/m.32338 type:complete len:153 (-) Transcript_13651:155-613(-)